MFALLDNTVLINLNFAKYHSQCECTVTKHTGCDQGFCLTGEL